jgi:hypothetical protein
MILRRIRGKHTSIKSLAKLVHSCKLIVAVFTQRKYTQYHYIRIVHTVVCPKYLARTVHTVKHNTLIIDKPY